MGDNEETIATQEPEHRISVNDVVNAAAKGDIETLQAAASSGIGVHDRASVPPGMSPLMAAARHGHHEVISYLLETSKSTGLSARSWTHDTALHYACMGGDLQTVKLLVDEGADLGAQGDVGNTPLHIAAAFGHLNAVKLLVATGASLRVSNDYGNTPLDVATAPEIRATLKKAAGGRDARKEIGAEVEEVLWDIVNKTGDESRRASVELTAQSRPMAGRGVEDEQAAAEWEERLRQHEAAQKRRDEEDAEEDRIDEEVERARREEEERIRREEEERIRAEEEERKRLEEEAAAKKKKGKKGKGKKK